MKKQANNTAVLGALIGVIGLALLVYGIYQYNVIHQSVVKSLGNTFDKLIKGSSRPETLAIAEMIAGGGLALVGAFLAFGRRKR